MIGIEFKYDLCYGNIFQLLLKGIDINAYNWDIKEFDAITKNGKNLDESNTIVENLMNEKESYMTIFANIRVFPTDSQISIIDTYNDFLNSDCELIILVIDVYEYEIYFKKSKLKDILLQNLRDLNISYSIKTIDNDERIGMYVF